MKLLYRYIHIFAVCSIAGFVVENLWCVLKNKRIESRKSLVYGPFSVIYGIGGVFLTLILNQIGDASETKVFLVSFMTGSLIEYLCSFCQEHIWGTVSWDYKQIPLNINGRVCLFYSMFWGVLGVVWYKHIIPFIGKVTAMIPAELSSLSAWSFVIFFLFDALLSSAAVLRMVDRAKGIEAKSKLHLYLDKSFPDDRLHRIYSNMQLIKK